MDRITKKTALVHDFLLRRGGAERVVKSISELFPDAPIFTLLHDKSYTDEFFPDKKIYGSFLERMPFFIKKKHKNLGILMPSAIESMDFRDYDVVITSSASFAKGVIVRPKTVHICYCHSPARYLWDYHAQYLLEQRRGYFVRKMARMAAHYLRVWDISSSDRPDFLIANSKTTQARIKKYWRRDSEVIYPPFNDSAFNLKKDFKNEIKEKNYFLIVSRLTKYKKIDLAVSVFNKMNLPLVIIGTGPEESNLLKMAGPSIKLISEPVSEMKLKEYYHNALAFLMPQEEDLGIAALEAMACGKPVLAYGAGGATETVRKGVSGDFFYAQNPEILADSVRSFMGQIQNFQEKAIADSIKNYTDEIFKKKITDFIISKLSDKTTL